MNDQEILKQKIKNLNPPAVIVIIKNDSLLAQNFINDIKNITYAQDKESRQIDFTVEVFTDYGTITLNDLSISI